MIFLAIADFIMFPEKAGYKSEHRILDTKSYENDLQDFSFVFFELPKFRKNIEELANLEEKWMYFFKHAEDSTFAEIEDLIGNDKIIRRAFEAIDQASWDEEELRTYEHITKVYWDNLAVEQYKLKEAALKGLNEGMEKGMEKGRQEGLKEGVLQRNIEIAKVMLSQGYTISDIAKLTGLSYDEIKKI